LDNINYFNLKEKIAKIMKSIEYFILEKQEDGYKFNLLNIWNKDTLPDIIENIKQSNISNN
jgi:phospholipid/cholesterol/gamma-HCH transport system permease protein